MSVQLARWLHPDPHILLTQAQRFTHLAHPGSSSLLGAGETPCFSASLTSLAPATGLAAASLPSLQRRQHPMFSVPPSAARSKCPSRRRFSELLPGGALPVFSTQMFSRVPPGAKSPLQTSRTAHC